MPAGMSVFILPHNFLKFGMAATRIQFINRSDVTLYHALEGSTILYLSMSIDHAIPESDISTYVPFG